MTARFGGRKVESERERKNQKKKFFEDGPTEERPARRERKKAKTENAIT